MTARCIRGAGGGSCGCCVRAPRDAALFCLWNVCAWTRRSTWFGRL